MQNAGVYYHSRSTKIIGLSLSFALWALKVNPNSLAFPTYRPSKIPPPMHKTEAVRASPPHRHSFKRMLSMVNQMSTAVWAATTLFSRCSRGRTSVSGSTCRCIIALEPDPSSDDSGIQTLGCFSYGVNHKVLEAGQNIATDWRGDCKVAAGAF